MQMLRLVALITDIWKCFCAVLLRCRCCTCHALHVGMYMYRRVVCVIGSQESSVTFCEDCMMMMVILYGHAVRWSHGRATRYDHHRWSHNITICRVTGILLDKDMREVSFYNRVGAQDSCSWYFKVAVPKQVVLSLERIQKTDTAIQRHLARRLCSDM